MFSKRHYETIANTLFSSKPIQDEGALTNQWRRTVREFMRTFTDDNPKFNPTRFMEACRYTP